MGLGLRLGFGIGLGGVGGVEGGLHDGEEPWKARGREEVEVERQQEEVAWLGAGVRVGAGVRIGVGAWFGVGVGVRYSTYKTECALHMCMCMCLVPGVLLTY